MSPALLAGAVLLGASVVAGASLLLRPPRWLLDRVSRAPGEPRLRVVTRERALALTFDDAPGPGVTPGILERLDRHEARATFFVIGSHGERHPELLGAIRERGHELASHLFTDRMSARLGDEEVVRELHATADVIAAAAPETASGAPARSPRWCRPGHGVVTPRLARLLRERGHTPVLASAYPLDLRAPESVAAAHLLANVRPGAILVLHDGPPDRARTVRILDRVLPAIRRRGYRLLTLSDLVALERE